MAGFKSQLIITAEVEVSEGFEKTISLVGLSRVLELCWVVQGTTVIPFISLLLNRRLAFLLKQRLAFEAI